jgi:hypothetical protein
MSGETESPSAASATVCRSPGNVELNDARARPLIRTEAKKGYSVAAAIRTTPMAVAVMHRPGSLAIQMPLPSNVQIDDAPPVTNYFPACTG